MGKDNKRCIHKTAITWNEKKKIFLCSFGDKTIKIAASPEPGKDADVSAPGELFVDSIEGFIKDAFMDSARRNNLEILSYESEGHGIVEKVEDKLMFTEINIRPRIVVAADIQAGKAKELIELAGKDSFVSNLVMCKISITPEIKTRGSF